MKISWFIRKLEEIKAAHGDIEVLHRMDDGLYKETYPYTVKVIYLLDGTIKKIYHPTSSFIKANDVEDIVEV